MFRRDFFKFSMFSTIALNFNNLQANTSFNKNNNYLKTTIAICGAGFAGLSCVKRLKELKPNLDITLIEQNNSFSSCPFSNQWLTNISNISYEDLNFSYYNSINRYNYNFINEKVINIDKDKKLLYMSNNKILKYEYLILSTGIDYDYEKILKDNEKIKQCKFKAPAGLKPGSEHLALKKMIQNFKGGNFIISIPSGAYKCPPAPYERACLIAQYFKSNKIKAKVIVLDPREKPASKPNKFLNAFNTYYKDYINYKPYTNFKDIDFEKKEITFESFDMLELDYKTKKLSFEEANIIPPNKANKLIQLAKLETNNGFAKLQEPTFRSISSPYIYVVGDAQGQYPFPKSAQMANSCAYVLSEELISRLDNKTFDYKSNLPGNVCYSMISKTKAVSIMHEYSYKNDKLKVKAEVSNISKEVAQTAKAWYFGLTEDILG
ncbi:hypothetical protein CPG37_04055 [Malaciobacter canalis]|uniref:NAD(P)/FAD-dependent oxidoreductase n=1 Tax=Malaciobacter canalis TaxID=1912871 RepID=A0ABX4LRP1_9BACT|nr:FAD-dependent oxidoreductase [Malaciobacter canalis]PHO10629.1 hypothetical protein CPG37_04055 [Malaciobacter canalis]QEE32079.1 NAD(P)/FAD-dependent oxidoreductase [Malaciobacter canalis]